MKPFFALLLALAGCAAPVDGLAPPACIVAGQAFPACDGQPHDYAVQWTDQATGNVTTCLSESNIAEAPCVVGDVCRVAFADGGIEKGVCQ